MYMQHKRFWDVAHAKNNQNNRKVVCDKPKALCNPRLGLLYAIHVIGTVDKTSCR